MTAPTQPVTINIADFGGPAVAGIVVTARLSDVDYTEDGTFVSTKPVTGTTNSSGVTVLQLFPNAPAPDGLGTRNTTVIVTAFPPASRPINVEAVIPDAPCNLADVLVNDTALDTVAYVPPTQLADYAALRAYAGHRTTVYVTGYQVSATPSGIAGLFLRDDSDTTSTDDGGTVIVSATGKRWKRAFDGALELRWFGADRLGAADSSPALAAAYAAAKKRTITDTYPGVLYDSPYFLKGGVMIHADAGKYLLATDPGACPQNVGIVGDGKLSTIFLATYNGRVIRDDPIATVSGTYSVSGQSFRDFGIIGDRTKVNQIGLSLMRGVGAQVQNIYINQCGSYGMECPQFIVNRLDNVEISMCGAAGLRVTTGFTSYSDSTTNNLPSNQNTVTQLHCLYNDGPGILFDGEVNGCTFVGGACEYNYYSANYNCSNWAGATAYTVNRFVKNGGKIYRCIVAGTSAGAGGPSGTGASINDGTVTWQYICATNANGGVGYQIEFRHNAFVPSTFDGIWTEGNCQAYVYLNCTDVSNAVRLQNWPHFGGGAAGGVERALIVDKGTALVHGAHGHGAQYRDVTGSGGTSKKPFRFNKASGQAVIFASDCRGSTIADGQFVEDENQNASGFGVAVTQDNFGVRTGSTQRSIVPFGDFIHSVRQEGESGDFMAAHTWDATYGSVKGWQFGPGDGSYDTFLLRLQAGVFGGFKGLTPTAVAAASVPNGTMFVDATANELSYRNTGGGREVLSTELTDYTALRAYAGTAKRITITGYLVTLAPSGIAGTFVRDDSDTTTADNGGTVIVTAGSKRWKRVYAGPVHVTWFGADRTGVANSTSALQAAHAASREVHYPSGTYKILLTEGQFLFKGTSGRYKFTGDNAMILDTTTYTANGAFTQMFWVDATDSLKVDGINYTGPAIPTPTVNHGYTGSSFVRATSGAKNIEVNAYIENARHGIHSGDYDLPALGNCDGFKGRLRTKFVGYTVALYLASNLDLDIQAESTHRAAYLAGCKGGRVHAYFKNQYIAPIQVLLTDATLNGLTYGSGLSRGCSDLDVKAHDMGSTTWVAGSFCAAISQSRGDAGTVYENLSFDVFVKSDDTTAATLSAFAIYNNYTPYAPSYPGNWTNPPTFRNIKLTGTLDRSAQTIAENASNGEIYVYTTDDVSNNAVVQGLSVKDFIYVPGSGSKPQGFWFSMPGLIGQAKFDNCNFGTDVPFLYRTNATSSSLFVQTTLRGSAFGTSDAPYNSSITFLGCTIAQQAFQPFTNKRFINTTIQGGGAEIKHEMVELTLAGASVTWAGALPNQSIILGVSGIVTQAITGASGYQVGDGTTVARFVDTNTVTLGGTWSVSNGTDTTPKVQVGTGSIVVTAKTANFTGGKLRLMVAYIKLTAPTS
jgi:hypothetical protein